MYLSSFYILQTIISNSEPRPLKVTKYCITVQNILQIWGIISAAPPGVYTGVTKILLTLEKLFLRPFTWPAVSTQITINYLFVNTNVLPRTAWMVEEYANHQELSLYQETQFSVSSYKERRKEYIETFYFL